MTPECVVCFEQEKEYVKCSSPECKIATCVKCMKGYLEISIEEGCIPKCPERACRRVLVLSNLPQNLHTIYAKCCFKELFVKHGENARKINEANNTVENLRKLREQFVKERFPTAISFTASVIMPEKLRRLDKQLVEKVKKQSLNSKRKCMNLTCNGSLDISLEEACLVCITCDTKFCQECEKRIGKTHICKKDDIESVQAMKEMVQCPKCLFTIIRSDGCNNMTCSNCKQKFLYTTGEAGGSGSDNTFIGDVVNSSKRYLSVVYKSELSEACMKLVLTIEKLDPPDSEKDNAKIMNMFLTYYKKRIGESEKTSDLDSLNLELAKAYEKYATNTIKNKTYQQAINDIESHIANKTLTVFVLKEILRVLERSL